MSRLLIALLLLLRAGAALADIDLRWEAHWSSLAPLESGAISVMIDDEQALRTIEVWATYDPAVVTGLTAEPGALFDGVPCYLWEGYEEPEPGAWHGYVVIIGGDCSITGPGELLRWSFTAGDVVGSTRVETVQVDLYDPAANLLAGVRLPAATLAVSPTPTAVPDAGPFGFHLAPNPFNPRTRITLDLTPDTEARLEIRDLRGRLLATPWRGRGGALPVDWDASDLPSGVYLVRLIAADGRSRTLRATLLR
jgi:hypothetical protein